MRTALVALALCAWTGCGSSNDSADPGVGDSAAANVDSATDTTPTITDDAMDSGADTSLVKPPVLGDELVVNGGFEGGLTPWGNHGNTVQSSDAHAGSGAARVGAGAGGPFQKISVVSGTTYRLSGFAKADPGNGGAVFRATYTLPAGMSASHNRYLFSSGYQRLTIDFTVPAGVTDVNVSLWTNAGTGYAYLDDVSLRSVVPSSPVPVLVDEGDSISVSGLHSTYYASGTADLLHFAHAVGGSSMTMVVDRKNAVLDRKPKDGAPWVVTLLIGANDLAGSEPVAYANRLFAYCDEMRAAGAKCALSTVLPSALGAGHNTKRAVLNPLIRSAVGVHADAVIDYAADPKIGPDSAAADLTYYSDGLHPTSGPGGGQERMFLVYKPVVDALLGKSP